MVAEASVIIMAVLVIKLVEVIVVVVVPIDEWSLSSS